MPDDLKAEDKQFIKRLRERAESSDLSRRDMLQLAGATGFGALLGGGGLLSATDRARAGTAQVGTLGEANNPVDLVAEDVYGPDGQGGTQPATVPRIDVEELNGADMQNAAAGEVPLSDGDGTFTMGTAGGNVPNWQEDANSPFTATGVQSKQFTIDGTYQIVKLLADSNNIGFNQLQINGNTSSGNGNYDYIESDGTTTSSADLIPIEDDRSRAELNIRDGGALLYINAPIYSGSPGDTVGGNTTFGGPIDTITLSDSGSFSRDTNIRVYGWNP